MILSYHPIYEADENRLCAGRAPNEEDRIAMERARAVILPQGCPQTLWEMARNACAHVFPDYRCRFEFPGKIGQYSLFQRYGAATPKTFCWASVSAFLTESTSQPPMDLPFVFKFNWGGEGFGTFLVQTQKELPDLLEKAADMERADQPGFLIQEKIVSDRVLRVVVIGRRLVAYWRVRTQPQIFAINASSGARIDTQSQPERLQTGRQAVMHFCRQSGINLAGFDLLFQKGRTQPFFLEINYFFGRQGLGGSESYYKILTAEIDHWLEARSLLSSSENPFERQ